MNDPDTFVLCDMIFCLKAVFWANVWEKTQKEDSWEETGFLKEIETIVLVRLADPLTNKPKK